MTAAATAAARRQRMSSANDGAGAGGGGESSQQEWCVIAPGATECYFGLGGDAHPAFSVTEPWSSLDVLPEALFAANAPLAMRKFGDHLRGRPCVMCVPVTCPDSTRARLCCALFETAGASAVCLLSEPVACSFACGRTEAVTVLDLSWTHATASFVEGGRTTKFASSTSLGLKRYYESVAVASLGSRSSGHFDSASSPLSAAAGGGAGVGMPRVSLDSVARGPDDHAAFFREHQQQQQQQQPRAGAIVAWYAASAHLLESMCGRLPPHALRDSPILLVGGGGGCDGLGTAVSKIVTAAVTQQLRKAAAAAAAEAAEDGLSSSSSSSSASASSDDDGDSDDSDSDRVVRRKARLARGHHDNNNNNNNKAPSTAVSAASAAANIGAVRVGSVIRIPSHSSRLFAFRGAALVAATGVLEQTGSIARDEWRKECASAAAAGSGVSRDLGRGASGVAGGVASKTARGADPTSWSSFSDEARERLEELVAWRFPK